MQRCSHSLSTATLLRSVFFPSSNQTCISTFLAPSASEDYYTLLWQQQIRRRTNYAESNQKKLPNVRRLGPDAPATHVATAMRTYGDQKDRRPRDEEIKSPYVRVAGGSGASSSTMQKIEAVLSTLDRSKEFLVQVSPIDAGEVPVCRIMSRKEYFAYEQNKTKQAVQTGSAKAAKLLKQLEFSWNIDKNDLKHRLDKAEDFLADGKKLEITIAAKRRAKEVPIDVCVALVKSINERLLSHKSVKEGKPMEGRPGATAKLFFETK